MKESHSLSLLRRLDSHCREDPGSMPAALYPVKMQEGIKVEEENKIQILFLVNEEVDKERLFIRFESFHQNDSKWTECP